TFKCQDKMKYFFALISFVCFAQNAVQAQTTITYDDFYPPLGHEVHYTAVLNAPDFDVWYGGADEIWDFSELDGIQLWVRHLPVDSGHVPNEFAGAEFMDWSELLFGGDYQEAYMSLGPLGVNFEGYYSQTWKYTYSDPRLSQPFPIDYGDIVVDQWESELEHQITLQQNDRTGETTFEYDGYGTLILPHITFNDAMRVHSVAEYEDHVDGADYT